MAATIDQLWRRYRRKGLLIDTNLLLTYFVGLCDRELLLTFKRTAAFSWEDFLLLGKFVTSFQLLVTTPNILTEVSNLLSDDVRDRCLAVLISQIEKLDERYPASTELVKAPAFPKFGLTDAGIGSTARGRYLVLTDDFRLSNHLRTEGQDVVNFNHLRQLNWRL